MKSTRSRAAATRKDSKEANKPAEDKIVGKRKAASRADKSNQKRSKNVTSAKKDPSKPKRPATAFFVFLEEFRTIYKQEHPKVKAVSAVGKAGGEKWKSMSNAVMHKTSTVAPLDTAMHRSRVRRLWNCYGMEKAPYEAKAAKRKSEYEKLMEAYNKKQETTDDEEEAKSEKSKSQANDKDDEESEEDEEDD